VELGSYNGMWFDNDMLLTIAARGPVISGCARARKLVTPISTLTTVLAWVTVTLINV